MRYIQAITQTELNKRRATSRNLPPEILAIILGYALCAEEGVLAPDETVWQGDMPTSAALFSLARVCRAWRHLLQSLASQWTVINDHEPGLFIRLSGRLPVSVHIVEHDSQLIRCLPDLGPRLRELFWGPRSFGPQKADVLVFPAPQLELLYLDHPGGPAQADGQPSPMLFAGHVPKLRRLDLANATWLPGNQFAALTHLCLQTVCAPLAFAAIVDLLRRCPLLEHLAFVGHMPLHPDDPAPHPLPPASDPELLPHLRRLSFERVASRFITNITHALRPRRPDFVFQAIQVPININTVALCMCALPFLATQPLTCVTYLRRNWHSNVVLIAMSAHTTIRFSTAHTRLDDNGWNPNHDTWWAISQLDRLAHDAIEEFTYDFLRIQCQVEPPLPVGARDVFARVRNMPRLREFNIATNDLSVFLVLLYGGSLVPLGAWATRWHIPVLRILVKGHGPGYAPETRDVFIVEESRIPEGLVIDKVEIYCDLNPAVFERTLDTLRAIGPSVEYRQTGLAEATTAAAMQRPAPPPGFVNCVDPVANPEWVGAQWDDMDI